MNVKEVNYLFKNMPSATISYLNEYYDSLDDMTKEFVDLFKNVQSLQQKIYETNNREQSNFCSFGDYFATSNNLETMYHIGKYL